MKVLLDMNLSPRWQTTLAEVGIEAVHWSNVGDPRAPDSLLASYALSNALVVLAQDLDFGALLAGSGDSGPSVLQIRAGATLTESIRQLVFSALEQFADELEKGALVAVDVKSAITSGNQSGQVMWLKPLEGIFSFETAGDAD